MLIKPNANKPQVRMAVSKKLISLGFRIKDKGPIWTDKMKLNSSFDKQYLHIAKKSMLQSPTLMNLTTSASTLFHEKFGLYWHEAIQQKLVYNSVELSEYMNIDLLKISYLWSKSYKEGKCLRLARGFHCVMIEIKNKLNNTENVFVINGFYQYLRKSFYIDNASVYYMVLEWNANDSTSISWLKLRQSIVGVSDPSISDKDSLRYMLYSKWKDFELAKQPTIEDNCIHISASAFEACIDMLNWLQVPLLNDPLIQAMILSGVPFKLIGDWLANPQIKGNTIFDHFENLGFSCCLKKATELYEYSNKTLRTINLVSNLNLNSRTKPIKLTKLDTKLSPFQPRNKKATTNIIIDEKSLTSTMNQLRVNDIDTGLRQKTEDEQVPNVDKDLTYPAPLNTPDKFHNSGITAEDHHLSTNINRNTSSNKVSTALGTSKTFL